jgi:methionyl-tRNA synthetase
MRKHLPIYTELEQQNVKEVVQAGAISRRLESSVLEDATDHQEEIIKLIEEVKLDEAMEEITSIMKKATSRLKMKKNKTLV